MGKIRGAIGEQVRAMLRSSNPLHLHLHHASVNGVIFRYRTKFGFNDPRYITVWPAHYIHHSAVRRWVEVDDCDATLPGPGHVLRIVLSKPRIRMVSETTHDLELHYPLCVFYQYDCLEVVFKLAFDSEVFHALTDRPAWSLRATTPADANALLPWMAWHTPVFLHSGPTDAPQAYLRDPEETAMAS